MAINIYMQKADEDHSGALYKFGESEQSMIGMVFVDRATREVSLLHIDDPHKEAFYLPRVRQVLQRTTGEFPDSTFYTA